MKSLILAAFLAALTAHADDKLPPGVQDYLAKRKALERLESASLPELMAETEVARLQSLGSDLPVRELQGTSLRDRIRGEKPGTPTVDEVAKFLDKNREGRISPPMKEEEVRDLMLVLRKENGKRRGGEPTDRSMAREALANLKPGTIPPLSDAFMTSLKREYARLNPREKVVGPLNAGQIVRLLDNSLLAMNVSETQMKDLAGVLVQYTQMANPSKEVAIKEMVDDINYALRMAGEPPITLEQFQAYLDSRTGGAALPGLPLATPAGKLPMSAPDIDPNDRRLKSALDMRNGNSPNRFRSNRMLFTQYSSPGMIGRCNGEFVGPAQVCNQETRTQRVVYATADHCLPPDQDTDQVFIEGIGLVEKSKRFALRQPGEGSDDFAAFLMDIPCNVSVETVPVCQASQVANGSLLVTHLSNVNDQSPTKRMIIGQTFDIGEENFTGFNVMGSYNNGIGIFPGDSGSPTYSVGDSACYAGAVSAKYEELPPQAQDKLGRVATSGSLGSLRTWLMSEAYRPMEDLRRGLPPARTISGTHQVSLK